ncbi:ABC transporter permease subunit [Streptomyces sp. NPDC087440]|uniref:ABC transporter permease subunit n=1 Tax=Streptomyces sp. NPDC087440 TaxID=3365790 RepID=UPI0037FFE3F5
MNTPTPLATTTVDCADRGPEPPVRFGDLLAAEWIRMRSLRSTPWTIGCVALFVVGSAALSALVYVRSLSDVPAGYLDAREPFEYLPFTAFPPPGHMTLMLVAATLGALTVVSEYGSGLVRTLTVVVPARGSVVLAKAVVTAALWTAVGAVISLGCFLASQAVLDTRGVGVGITEPGVLRGLVASALLAPACALVGLGLGVLIRHTAATVLAGAFLLMLVPLLISPGASWSAPLHQATLFASWKRLVQTWGPSPDSLVPLGSVPGSWIAYVLWPLVAVALAVVVVRRRDV